jgi:hypothetical protein
MKSIDRMARCSKCNRSQLERRLPRIDGESHHDYVRAGIHTYANELKQLWAANQK